MKLSPTQLVVTVKGRAASGKSTVAHIIRKALLDEGITVELNDDSTLENEEGMISKTLDDRCETLSRRDTEVIIETKEIKRHSHA